MERKRRRVFCRSSAEVQQTIRHLLTEMGEEAEVVETQAIPTEAHLWQEGDVWIEETSDAQACQDTIADLRRQNSLLSVVIVGTGWGIRELRRVVEYGATAATPGPGPEALAVGLALATRSTPSVVAPLEWLVETQRCRVAAGLASAVAHEINNPLSAIITYASVLLRQATDEAGRTMGSTIRELCQNISSTVRTMADFMRLDREDSTPEAAPQEGWEEVLKLARPLLHRSQIRAETSVPQLPPVVLPRREFMQVLLSMVQVAVRSLSDSDDEAHPEKVLSVRGDVSKDETYVRFSVGFARHPDTGKGGLAQRTAAATLSDMGSAAAFDLRMSGELIRRRGGQLSVLHEEPDGLRSTVDIPVFSSGTRTNRS